MKRVLSCSPVILGVLYAVLPVAQLTDWLTGYTLALYSYPACAVVLAVLSLAATLLLMIPERPVGKVNAVFCGLLPALAAFNAVCYVAKSQWKPLVVCMLVCCGCALTLLFRYTKPTALKVVSGILSSLLILLSLPIMFLFFLFSDSGINTVLQKLPSPQKTHTAQVIYGDQGATGGATIVTVSYNNQSFNLLFGRVYKSPTRVYAGRGDINPLEWKDEHTLLINGVEHAVH